MFALLTLRLQVTSALRSRPWMRQFLQPPPTRASPHTPRQSTQYDAPIGVYDRVRCASLSPRRPRPRGTRPGQSGTRPRREPDTMQRGNASHTTGLACAPTPPLTIYHVCLKTACLKTCKFLEVGARRI
ncbi:hypothetical protein C8Q78DRAFT_1026295 [Trametes maxima]|nr:hypothetical protein C8Q78DRAFT_1026295 [Trametes maxima]